MGGGEHREDDSAFRRVLTEVLSGLVNGILMFVFCYVFASLVFGPPEVGLQDFVPLGAGTNTISAFVVGLAFAFYSDCAVSIAGPDINPTIFLAQMAVQIGVHVDEKYGDNLSTEEKGQIKLTTILFTVIFSSAIVGIWFFILGKFRLTRIVQFVPAAVLSGFLAAVGIIIMIKAVKASVGDELAHHPDMWQFWALLAPAIPIGVMLYCSKRFHLGSPIVMVPLCLFGPFILFYVVVYATGNDLDTVREMNLCSGHGELYCGWLYERYESVLVTEQWQMSYGSTEYIEWSAISLDVPIEFILLVIVTLDSLLKISGTKKQLGLYDLDYDHEIKLAGKANMLLPFLVGTPAYSQLKFNALNFGIVHNTKARLPGIVAALFNGVLFFAGFPLINFLPRFFVGAMLIYAGIGFVVENLLDTWVQNRLSLFEYLTVVIIVVLSQVLSMLVAVVVGIMLSFVLFVVQYSRTGVIKAVLSGKDFQSSVVRSTQEDTKLEHLSSQVVIIKLKRYIFFGSANQISDLVHDVIFDDVDDEEDSFVTERSPLNANASNYSIYSDDTLSIDGESAMKNRINTILFDFEDVYGIDFTACGIFADLLKQLVELNQAALAQEAILKQQLHEQQREDTTQASDRSTSGNSHRGGHHHHDRSTTNKHRPRFSTAGLDNYPLLHSFVRLFSRKPKSHAKPKQVTVLFTGMSDKVYRRLKSEGILDLIHLTGANIPDVQQLDEVLPSANTLSRFRRVGVNINSFFSKIFGTETSDGSGTSNKPNPRQQVKRDSGMLVGTKRNASSFGDQRQQVEQDSTDQGSPDSANRQDVVVVDKDYVGDSSIHDRLELGDGLPLELGPESHSARPLPEPETTDAYYLRADFPKEHRRIFPSLDLAMEWVEDRLLQRACQVRQKWLVFFESFRTLHEQARLKAQYEPFEHILGGHLGDTVWKYIQPVHIPEGCHLCTAGEINPHLFLLQHGKLTSYMVRQDETLIRIQTHRRGAYINEDALFVEYPLSHTVIADEDSIVLALSRENLKLLEANSPDIAFEIHRDVLRHTASIRNRLARELDVVDHWAMHERLAQHGGDFRQMDTIQEHRSFQLASRSMRASQYSTGSTVHRFAFEKPFQDMQATASSNILHSPERHMKSTSRSVGRMIMKQAERELNAQSSQALLQQDQRQQMQQGQQVQQDQRQQMQQGQQVQQDEDVPDTLVEANSQTVPAKAKSRADLSVQELLAMGNTPNNDTAGSEDVIVDVKRAQSSRSIRRSRSNVTDTLLARNPSLRNPSMCFRPDLQRHHFAQRGVGSPSFFTDHAPAVNIVDANLVRENLHLSQAQRVDAVACLKRAATNRFHRRGKHLREMQGDMTVAGQALAPTRETELTELFDHGLPKRKLRQTLMDMGHFPSEAELDSILDKHQCKENPVISEDEFLAIVRELSLEQLTDAHIQGFALFFVKHAKTLQGEEQASLSPSISVLPDKVLTVEGLQQVLLELGHPEDPHRLAKMVSEWSDFALPSVDSNQRVERVLQFASLCSMMAYHIKAEKLDEQVAHDFMELTQEKCIEDIILASDVMFAMRQQQRPCTRQEATEMIFEADVTGNGGVSYDDLVGTLTTVFESEIEPQLEQITQDMIGNVFNHS